MMWETPPLKKWQKKRKSTTYRSDKSAVHKTRGGMGIVGRLVKQTVK